MNTQNKIIWDNEKERLLCQLWKENAAALQKPETTQDTCVKISKILQDTGFQVEWKDVKDKIAEMTHQYKRDKENDNGANSMWYSYSDVDGIFSTLELINLGNNALVITIEPTSELNDCCNDCGDCDCGDCDSGDCDCGDCDCGDCDCGDGDCGACDDCIIL